MRKNKESNFVSAVVYLHKNEKDIACFLNMISTVLDENFSKYEVICVNDGISDAVHKQIERFKKEHNIAISIVNMGYTHGLEASMNAGIDLAIGDYVFEFDTSYIDYSENLIMEVYNKCMLGYDIVAARLPKKYSSLLSRIFYMLYNNFSDVEHKLGTERFRVISRRAINRVSAYSRTVPYRKAVYAASGLNISNILYEPVKSEGRPKKIDVAAVDTASDALVLFTNLAYRVSLFSSIIMAVVMFGFGVYTVLIYFGDRKPVEGWSPLMGLISLGFLGLFILMTFMFKYLEVIVRLVFKKQKYHISSIEKM